MEPPACKETSTIEFTFQIIMNSLMHLQLINLTKLLECITKT